MPRCPDCGGLSRPNILMFNDWNWQQERFREQLSVYSAWLDQVAGSRVVAIEMGAGLAIPTVRDECEERASGSVHPPGGTELIASAAELVGELAKAGFSTGERLFKDALSRLPLS